MSSGLALLTGGLFSVAVAGLSGFLAYYTARANSRATLDGELRKIREQIVVQQAAEEREAISELRQHFLTPLRYYAQLLSERFTLLADKYQHDPRTRGWFQVVKDHAARDRLKEGFVAWCYYEGFFAISTLYFTCSYFHHSREVRVAHPFGASRPRYSDELDAHLAHVVDNFAWDPEKGMWDAAQEMIGELFTAGGVKMTYAQLCQNLDSEESFRRAAYLRPLDVYHEHMTVEQLGRIKAALDDLVAFLAAHDPQTYDALHT